MARQRGMAARFESLKAGALLALLSAAAWAAKIGAMALADGSDDSMLVAVLYFLGLLSLVAAGGALAWAALRTRSLWLRLVATLAGAVAAFLLHQAMDPVSDAVVPGSGWLHEEAGIWLTAIVCLVVGIAILVRRPRGAPAAA